MPIATYPPRCPHRVVAIRLFNSLAVVLVSLAASSTATVSLQGKELEYRFVDLAAYVEAWPVEETKFLPIPLPSAELSTPTPIQSGPIESGPIEFGPAQPGPTHTGPTQNGTTQTGPTQTGPLQIAPIESGPTQSGLTQTTPTKTTLVAAKWRTNLAEPRVEKAPLDQGKLPGPALEDPGGNVEVLVIPKTTTDRPTVGKKPGQARKLPLANKQPVAEPRDCYQAPPLSVVSVSIALPAGELPANAAAECAAQAAPTGDARLAGAWAVTEHHWSATFLRHRPLYFEEINAERYGYTVSYTLQPVISAARFFATIPALPYKMAIDRPRDCIYTLGHYRPGSCAPRRWNRLPWKLSAGVVEAGFIAGMILLIP